MAVKINRRHKYLKQKILLFEKDLIICVENLKENTRKTLELIRKISNDLKYEISISKKQLNFYKLTMHNYQMKLKTIPFTIV